MIKVAINGFGRIGRNAFKVGFEDAEVEFVAVNDLASAHDLAYLLMYDSVYGRYDKTVEVMDNAIIVDGKKIQVFSQKDPSLLPWKELDVDIVLECTGIFRDKEKASLHVKAGAKRVIISAPSKGENVKTCLMGVNQDTIISDDLVIDNASCTTNSVAPVAALIHEHLHIKKAALTTIHAYTADQVLVDGPHKDARRGRAAAHNIIPTSTGAAIATTKAIPELAGKFDGLAIRVPVICGSLSDFTFVTKKKTTVEKLQTLFEEASVSDQFKGIMGVTRDPFVSSDIIKSTYSCIVDLSSLNVIDGDLIKILAWYDNEWAYCHRLIDVVKHIAKQ